VSVEAKLRWTHTCPLLLHLHHGRSNTCWGDAIERKLRDITSQVTTKLGGPGDYPDWAWCMKLLFEEHQVLDVVTGNTPHPRDASTDEERAEYAKLNRRALLLLTANVKANQMTYIRPYSMVVDAWAELNRVYQRATLTHQLYLREKLRTIRQREDEDILGYSRRLKEITLELEAAGAPVLEQEQIITLLEGVLPIYADVATTLENIPGELAFNEVVNRLLGTELRQQKLATDVGREKVLLSEPKGWQATT